MQLHTLTKTHITKWRVNHSFSTPRNAILNQLIRNYLNSSSELVICIIELYYFLKESSFETYHQSTLSAWYNLWLSSKESACNLGVVGSIPESGKSLGVGNDNSLQYLCLESPIHRATWWATVQIVTKCQTRLGG